MQALVLALSTTAYAHAVHAGESAETSPAGHLAHVVTDAALAAPLALVAVLAGAAVARTHAARAFAVAAGYAATLVPGSYVHGLIEQGHASHAWTVAHAMRDAVPALAIGFGVAWALGGRAVRRPRRAGDGRSPGMRAFAPAWVVAGLAAALVATTLPATQPAAFAVTLPQKFSKPLFIPPVLDSPAISIDIDETPVQILDGAPTTMWTYNGTFPGPTIRRPSGTPTTVTFTNRLDPSGRCATLPGAMVPHDDPCATTVHHHGNHSASRHDGQPADGLISPGESRAYTYEFLETYDAARGLEPERAAFQWYHDHRMDVTGRNVWMGLAGMVILDDEVDAALPLPKGEFDVPIMLADRGFDAGNQLVYTFNASGVRGLDAVLVNGVVQPHFVVGDRKYRVRVLNASNTASYDLRMSNGMPMTQIATDSGLLPAPITRSTLRLGPAERAEIVLDFAGRLGSRPVLQNVRGIGALRDLMEFRVDRDLTDDSSVPPVLRPLDPPPFPDVVDTRVWALTQSQAGPLTWTINFQSFDPARSDAKPKLGTAERWIFVNTTSADHLMHIHDVDWRLVRRISPDPYDEADALAEQGLKETFLVRPNEVIEVVARFTDHVGRYVFHCHVLEHEDRSMMAQFDVVG